MEELSSGFVDGIPHHLVDEWRSTPQYVRDHLRGLDQAVEEAATVAAYLPPDQPVKCVVSLIEQWFSDHDAELTLLGDHVLSRLRSIVLEAALFADADAASAVLEGETLESDPILPIEEISLDDQALEIHQPEEGLSNGFQDDTDYNIFRARTALYIVAEFLSPPERQA